MWNRFAFYAFYLPVTQVFRCCKPSGLWPCVPLGTLPECIVRKPSGFPVRKELFMLIEKLKSRKFWLVIGSGVSILIAELWGIDIAPEAIAGLALVVGSYVFGQGMVDKAQVTEQIKAGADIARLDAVGYARKLEAALAQLSQVQAEELVDSGVPVSAGEITE